MGRELKRVPLDFDAPLNEVWEGYIPSDEVKDRLDFPVRSCKECTKKFSERDDFCLEENTPYCVFHNPKWRDKWYHEPPTGDGYQLWETTSEGSPYTPVFATLDGLCEYAEGHCTTFGDFRATRDEWKKMLTEGFVHAKFGGNIYC